MNTLIPWRSKSRDGDSGAGLAPRRGAGGGSGLDRLFDRMASDPWSMLFADMPGALAAEWAPAVDIEETEDEVRVTAEIPGIDPEAVEVSVSDDVLTISGEKREEREERAGACWCSERAYGSFMRRIQLPASIDPDRVSAGSRDGVLEVRLEKREGSRPKRIKVSNSRE